jgi:hypothetical protein
MTDPWTREFDSFLKGSEAEPPASISRALISKVTRELNPSSWLVFLKAFAVHLFIGTLTLSVCPQFEYSPFTGSMGLMHFFMVFGEYGCMVACGAFFMGSSALALGLVLRPEELRVLRRREIPQFALMALLSIGLFLVAGAGIVLGMTAAWLAGSVLGAFGMLELAYAWRFREATES